MYISIHESSAIGPRRSCAGVVGACALSWPQELHAGTDRKPRNSQEDQTVPQAASITLIFYPRQFMAGDLKRPGLLRVPLGMLAAVLHARLFPTW